MDMNDDNRERSRFRVEWTEHEIALLEEHYMTFTAAEIQEKFLPERSTSAIYGKVKSLKLQKWPLDDTRANWTDEDVATLCEVYLEEGAEGVHQRLPHYTRSAIWGKAKYLGLRRSTSTRTHWSEEDRQWLVENIHLPIKKLVALFPQYSLESINRVRSGLRRDNAQAWSREELELLTEHYRDLSTSTLQHRFFPMRRLTDIRQKVSELKGGTPPPDPAEWSEEECNILRQHYLTMDSGKIQQRYLPFRSRVAIKSKARQLGLQKHVHRAWTPEEQQILKDVYPQGAAHAVRAMLPYRSRGSIHRKAYVLGLSGTRKRPVTAKEGKDGRDEKT